MSSKCPHCTRPLINVRAEQINIVNSQGSTWLGVTYKCPSCDAVLGVGIDPVALKTDTVN
jgi:uncharacterized protein with PIN domain